MAKVGSTSNSYRILAKLAAGGMAEIFLVCGSTATGVERYCVLKQVRPEKAGDARFVQMFLDEARLATQLQHPNIASVYDIGAIDDAYFYTMEYVHGETVHSLIQRAHELRRPLPLACVLTVIAGAAAGLHHAHERNAHDGRSLGIVHRDVSPSNVMVSYEGNTKLVDFGVAKASDRRVETHTGMVKGKIGYLSPEQCRCERVDRRSDLFSLGIVAWEMLTGGRLFRRASEFESMLAIVEETPPRPSMRRPEIPDAVDDIVMRLLTRSPAGRFQTAAAVVEAIENASIHAGTTLSTAAVSRMMHDLFGRRPEPWLELEQLMADAVTLVSQPLPEDLADAEDLPLVTGLAPSASASNLPSRHDDVAAPPAALARSGARTPHDAGPATASVEVSGSVVSLLPRAPVAELAGSPRSSGFDETSTEVAALRASDESGADAPAPADSEPPAPRAVSSSGTPASVPTSEPLRVAAPAAVQRTDGEPASSVITTWRRPARARLARRLIAATLVAAAVGVVALSLGRAPDAAPDRNVAAVEPARAQPVAGAAGVEPVHTPQVKPATPDPPSVPRAVGEPPAGDAPAAPGDRRDPHDVPGDAVDPPTPSGGAPRQTGTETPHVEATVPRTGHASGTKRAAPVDAASRAPGSSTPPPSAAARPSLESVRRGFKARDYAGVVAACGSVVVTSAIADLCTRAACRTHDMADARVWLLINPPGQIGRLVEYCSDLGNTPIRAPALDCSKDPLDCR
jgi:serine/threonine protein kinase